MLSTINIYTDSSARHNGNEWLCGYSIIFTKDDKILKEYTGFLKPATNNVGEMTAVIHALYLAHQWFPTEKLNIYTDSTYVLNGIDGHYGSNQKLWQLYLKLATEVPHQIEKVKAHSDNEFNNHVDKNARERLRKEFNVSQNS